LDYQYAKTLSAKELDILIQVVNKKRKEEADEIDKVVGSSGV